VVGCEVVVVMVGCDVFVVVVVVVVVVFVVVVVMVAVIVVAVIVAVAVASETVAMSHRCDRSCTPAHSSSVRSDAVPRVDGNNHSGSCWDCREVFGLDRNSAIQS